MYDFYLILNISKIKTILQPKVVFQKLNYVLEILKFHI